MKKLIKLPSGSRKSKFSDNRQLTTFLRQAHEVCDRRRDIATASLIENWIDESEGRVWYLNETTRGQ